ncbi:MAG: 3-deoxy-8-phosphooctulonate synthase [Kiritimatiellia bacterium]
MSAKPVVFSIGKIKVGGGHPLFIIAGPCVIESRKGCLAIARRLAALSREVDIPVIFKASYDKANRTSLSGFRGVGMAAGLDVLREVAGETGLPLLTDIHSPAEAAPVAKVVDVLQIPAFLCRQTDLLVAAGETGAAVNVKKGQFLAPWDVGPLVEKVESTGNRRILLTERGSSFGYNQLVVDMRSLPLMARTGYPVVFDATHSVQKPGGGGGYTSGDATMAPVLARAAVAAGCHGVFMETHVNPAEALSDRDNCLPLNSLRKLWTTLRTIREIKF